MDARVWIDDRIGLVLGNDDRINSLLQEAAGAAVAAYEPGISAAQRRETYEAAWHGGGAPGYQRHDYADAAGSDLRDVIWDQVTEASLAEPWHTLLLDILDYGDREMWAMVGETWLPMPGDVYWGEDDGGDDA